jgi:hypothetical protein
MRRRVNGCGTTGQGDADPGRGSLRLDLSQPWMVWVLLAGGVAVYSWSCWRHGASGTGGRGP